jgi:hypothetical protein
MTDREALQAILDGKKVGMSPGYYVYLNISGKLMGSRGNDEWSEPEAMLSNILYCGNAKILPEDGP